MNFKRLITGAAVLITSLSTTRALAAQASIPVENDWSITDRGDSFVEITLRFRNTQGIDPQRIFGITGLSFEYNGFAFANCNLFCSWSSPAFSTIGNVDKSSFSNNGHPVVFDLGPLAYSYAGNFTSAFFGPLLSTPGSDTWGVLGCQTVPDIPALMGTSGGFGGRTCAADGYDGWIQAVTTFRAGPTASSGIDLSNATESDFTAGAGGRYRVLPDVQVVPEPGTYALVAFGVGALALIRRKHPAV